MNIQPIIELEHVSKSFGANVIHRDISFSIYPAETVTLLGPSGTGKTVILKLILGLLTPDSGTVRVMGEDLRGMDESALNRLRMNIGMLFQGAALFDSLSVYDNVAYSLREHGEKDEQVITRTVLEKLETVGLADVVHKFPPQLSGGQKKRVGLARALASSPSVLLFDEPTTGLDPTARRMIDDFTIRLREQYGITSLVVTHDVESARRISNRWILINNGEILADGPVEEVIRASQPVIDFASGRWKEEGEGWSSIDTNL